VLSAQGGRVAVPRDGVVHHQALSEGLLVYPLRSECLVFGQGLPNRQERLGAALVKDEDGLVSANSRLALVSVIVRR